MPLYDFKDLTSGEIYTKMMSIADMEEHVKDKNIQQVMSAPKLISGAKVLYKRLETAGKKYRIKIKKGLPPRLRDNIKTK